MLYNIKDAGLSIHTECLNLHKSHPRWFSENLNGACAIASFALYEFLQKQSLKCKFILGKYIDNTHCWVELENQIIDLTATQFGSEHKVYTPIKDDNYCPQYYNKFALNIVRGWSYHSPYKYIIYWEHDKCLIVGK
jgi:hypothetical protein